jgi:hypothetical protein
LPSRRGHGYGRSVWISLARWWMSVIGGILIGVGLLLCCQIHVVRHLRQQVEDAFFFRRWVGKVTFVAQTYDVQTALVLNKINESTIQECERIAIALLALGSACALSVPFLRKR